MNAFLKMAALCCAVPLALPSSFARADSYPDKPIAVVVPFGPGGTSDIVARIAGQSMGAILKQQVVIENKPGAGGNIGANYVARAPSDGYTLLAGFPGLTTNPSLYRKLNYKPEKDFIPISLLASAPNVIVVAASSPTKSLQELIERGRQASGKLNFGSAGAGTSSHLAGELLSDITGMKMQHVPYKGGAPALTDLASGRLDLMVIPLPESIGLITSGKLKALALASSRRSPLLPDVPTTKEAGLANFEVGSWYGLLAPAGTPATAVAKLSSAAQAALQNDTVKKAFDKQGIQMIASSPAEFAQFLRDETKRWKAVIEKSQIHLD